MREILFRGKTPSGNWVEGFFLTRKQRYKGNKTFISEKRLAGANVVSGRSREREFTSPAASLLSSHDHPAGWIRRFWMRRGLVVRRQAHAQHAAAYAVPKEEQVLLMGVFGKF